MRSTEHKSGQGWAGMPERRSGAVIVTAAGTLLLGEAEIVMLLSSPLLKVAMMPYLAAIDPIIEHLADQQTTASGVEAAGRGITGPTHSQIAKDAPDHPLFKVSTALAEDADRQIGTAMQAAWAARATSGAQGRRPKPRPNPSRIWWTSSSVSRPPTRGGEGRSPVP